MNKRIPTLLLAMVLTQPCFQSRAQTVPDKMNYQGVIANSSGVPLPTGDYNLVFRTYDAATGGMPTWGPKTNFTSVVAGQFNVALGPLDDATPAPRALSASFATGTRFLEIQVGANPPILPRQQILSAPYAFEAGHAASATTASTLVNSSGTPLITSSGNSVTVAGPVTASSFTGNGAGLNSLTASQIPSLDAGKITTGLLGNAQIPNLDAGKITSGFIDARLSGNVALLNRTPQAFTGINTFAGNVGIGTTTPEFKLQVVGEDQFIGVKGGGSVGFHLNNTAPGGRDWTLYSTPASGSALVSGFAIYDNTPGAGYRLVVNSAGNVGIGTVTPAAKLEVRGDIKLGTSGQYFAPAADENLRIVRGTVAANASPIAGAGFTAINTSVGNYTITFNSAFAGIPTVTANSSQFANVASVSVATSNSFTVNLHTPTLGNYSVPFSFIAIGPR